MGKYVLIWRNVLACFVDKILTLVSQTFPQPDLIEYILK